MKKRLIQEIKPMTFDYAENMFVVVFSVVLAVWLLLIEYLMAEEHGSSLFAKMSFWEIVLWISVNFLAVLLFMLFVQKHSTNEKS